MKAIFSPLILLILAVGADAYYAEDAVQEALMEVQADMASEMNLPEADDQLSRANKIMPFLEEAENSKCCACTKGSAKWVMDHVVAAIKKKCAETECEKFKKMCEKAGEHPEIAFGYLIGAVRPVSLGYAWCNGKGVCGKGAEEEGELTFEDATTLAKAMDALVKESEKEEESEDIIPANGLTDLSYEAEDGEEGGVPCRKCLKKVSKVFMFKTIGKIKKICHTTKCPVLQKMCTAAYKHPKVAFGYLFYKFRPVEFAAGFCVGKGACHPEGGCSQHHDEIAFDLMEDENMSFDDASNDDAIFY